MVEPDMKLVIVTICGGVKGEFGGWGWRCNQSGGWVIGWIERWRIHDTLLHLAAGHHPFLDRQT